MKCGFIKQLLFETLMSDRAHNLLKDIFIDNTCVLCCQPHLLPCEPPSLLDLILVYINSGCQGDCMATNHEWGWHGPGLACDVTHGSDSNATLLPNLSPHPLLDSFTCQSEQRAHHTARTSMTNHLKETLGRNIHRYIFFYFFLFSRRFYPKRLTYVRLTMYTHFTFFLHLHWWHTAHQEQLGVQCLAQGRFDRDSN